MNATSLRRVLAAHGDAILLTAAVAFVLIRVALTIDGLIEQSSSGDLGRYYEIVTGGIAYRDQQVEYPPFAVLVLQAIYTVTRSREAFGLVIVATMAAIDAGLCVLMWRCFGRRVGIVFLAVDTLVFEMLLTRIDVIPAALTAAFVALLTRVRPRPVPAALAWIGAVGVKLWPLPLGVFLLDALRGRGRVAGLIAAAAGGGALVAGWFAVGGLAGFRDVLTYRGATGWQMESVVGAAVRLASGATVVSIQGADRLGTATPLVTVSLLVAGTAGSLLAAHAAARRGLLGTGWLAAVLMLLVTSTLLSPQFLVWTVPAVAIAFWESVAAALAASTVAFACVLTLVEYDFYKPLRAGSVALEATVVARNAILLLALVLAIGAIVAERHRGPLRQNGGA